MDLSFCRHSGPILLLLRAPSARLPLQKGWKWWEVLIQLLGKDSGVFGARLPRESFREEKTVLLGRMLVCYGTLSAVTVRSSSNNAKELEVSGKKRLWRHASLNSLQLICLTEIPPYLTKNLNISRQKTRNIRRMWFNCIAVRVWSESAAYLQRKSRLAQLSYRRRPAMPLLTVIAYATRAQYQVFVRRRCLAEWWWQHDCLPYILGC